MIEEKFLEVLPENYRHEKYFLIKNKLDDFKKLSQLSDFELNNIHPNHAEILSIYVIVLHCPQVI